jgi:hypothetical protein
MEAAIEVASRIAGLSSATVSGAWDADAWSYEASGICQSLSNNED